MIEPLEDRVLVILAKGPRETKGGLILPDIARQDESQLATVIAVGTGKTGEDGFTILPMKIVVNDVVVLPKYGGHYLELEGQELKLIRQSDVLGIVR